MAHADELVQSRLIFAVRMDSSLPDSLGSIQAALGDSYRVENWWKTPKPPWSG